MKADVPNQRSCMICKFSFSVLLVPVVVYNENVQRTISPADSANLHYIFPR